MSEALAQTISYVNRARAFMPAGTVSPFVIRFDAGTVPWAMCVFSSESRTLGEIQDLALNRVRPGSRPAGLTSPPPFGGNQRTVVVTINPDQLRAYNMSPDEVAQAVNRGEHSQPAGNLRTGNLLRIAQSDSVTPNIKSRQSSDSKRGQVQRFILGDVGTNSRRNRHSNRLRAGEWPEGRLHTRHETPGRFHGRPSSTRSRRVCPTSSRWCRTISSYV